MFLRLTASLKILSEVCHSCCTECARVCPSRQVRSNQKVHSTSFCAMFVKLEGIRTAECDRPSHFLTSSHLSISVPAPEPASGPGPLSTMQRLRPLRISLSRTRQSVRAQVCQVLWSHPPALCQLLCCIFEDGRSEGLDGRREALSGASDRWNTFSWPGMSLISVRAKGFLIQWCETLSIDRPALFVNMWRSMVSHVY